MHQTISTVELAGALSVYSCGDCIWTICGSSANKIALINALTHEHLGSFTPHDSSVVSVVPIPNQNIVWTSSTSEIKIWEANGIDLRCITTIPSPISITHAMVNSNLCVLFGSSEGSVIKFNANGQPEQELVMTFSSDEIFTSVRSVHGVQSSLFIISERSIQIWPDSNDLHASATQTKDSSLRRMSTTGTVKLTALQSLGLPSKSSPLLNLPKKNKHSALKDVNFSNT